MPEVWSPGTMVQSCTTCTRGSPFFPVTGVNVSMHVSVTGPEGLQEQEQKHQTMNQHTKGRKQLEKNDERVNNLHRLRDHCVSDWFSVLLATVECLRRGAEGCWCWCSRDQTEKVPSESEEKPKVRYSMTHLLGE